MNAAGREVTVTIGDKDYRLARFDVKVISELVKWAASRLPDPLTELEDRLQKFPENVQKYLVQEAIKRKQGRQEFNDPEIQAQIKSIDGACYTLWLLFHKWHPELSLDDVGELVIRSAQERGEMYLAEKIGETYGKVPVSESQGDKEALQKMGVLPDHSFR